MSKDDLHLLDRPPIGRIPASVRGEGVVRRISSEIVHRRFTDRGDDGVGVIFEIGCGGAGGPGWVPSSTPGEVEQVNEGDEIGLGRSRVFPERKEESSRQISWAPRGKMSRLTWSMGLQRRAGGV